MYKLSLKQALGIACWISVCTAVTARIHAEPASHVGAYEPERLQDPYQPGEGQRSDGLRSIPRTPPGTVQVNVNASGLNIVGDAANEPSIAIDPTNPQRLAITWRQFDTISSNFRQGGYAYSTNGGASWTFPGVIEPGIFNSDPVLAADNTGRFFWSALHSSLCMSIWQSTNAGQSWPIGVAAFGGDKQWMAIDRTGGIGEGQIYVAWQTAVCSSNPNSNQFTRSIDHGNSWMTPIAIPNNPIFGVVAVGPDGAFYVTGRTSGSASTFVVAKSTNAQNPGLTPTWAFSVTGNFLGGSQGLNVGPNPGGLLGQVWIAPHPMIASHVYLLCSVNPPSADPLDVMFARSVDGGQTWSTPKRVNDDSLTNNAYQWFGTMSVAPNGRIDVVWNDTRDDPSNVLSRLYYSNSTDEGVTWSPNAALTPQWNSTVGWPQQNKIGDYYHMISDNDGASLAYAATFNNEQDVYFMRICPGAVIAPTSATVDRNNFCADDSGNIALTAVGGSGGTVHWFDDACGGHDIGTGSPLTIPSPIQTTTYFTRREITNCALSNCASVTVTVSPAPAAPTNPAANPSRICVGQTSMLSADAGAGETVEWSWRGCGVSPVPDGPNPTVSPIVTTTYYARTRNLTTGCLSECAPVIVTIADHTGDFDGNGVGESDLATFVAILLAPGTPQDCIADMNSDGVVDGNDIQPWTVAFVGP